MSSRLHALALVLLATSVLSPAECQAQPKCTAADLSDQQVREIIDTERTNRADLPAPFPKYRSVVRRQGCHYVYIEYPIPAVPEQNNIFRLNQQGVLVDAETGGRAAGLKCPDKELTESDLAAIVEQQRQTRSDLPPAFPNFRARVDRLRCLYLYFEYAVPETKGNYHVFTIDPFGELMEFTRAKPY